MRRNLKQARTDTKLSQSDISSMLGVSVQAVYLWEQGRSNVARKHWSKLASLLHVSESELEEILIQTILDECITANDSSMIVSALKSKMFRNELLLDAMAKFDSRFSNTPTKFATEVKKLEYERAILERDKRIFELEKEVDELKKQLAELGKKPLSLSSALNLNHTEAEVSK